MQVSSAEILFEKYEIIGCLKKDIHSAVYTANHIYLHKKIILKTLNTREIQDKVIIERFKREARLLALLDHPNLIKVLDFGTYGDHFYISFEYFESSNLRELINKGGLSYEQKTHLLIQLLKALNIAHQNNIVHRDIKPENILVNKNFELKIADFGLAVFINENALTNKASIVGTPGYMSPEQIRGDNLTIQSDIFSTGTVALELFTGSNPFLGKNINETINSILTLKEEKVNELVKDLSPAVQKVIKQMLKKSINDRNLSINDILGILGVTGEIYTPVEAKVSKRKKSSIVILSLSAAVLLIVFSFLFFSGGPNKLNPSFGFGNLNIMKFQDSDIPENSDEVAITDTQSVQQTIPNKVSAPNGRLLVEVTPWADVYINNRKFSTTPLENYITLKPGNYSIKLIHPDYPVYSRNVEIGTEKIERLNVNFKEMAGYLDCKIYPWGEIYINDEYKSQTPLRQPIVLLPGKYRLTVKNPQFGTFTESIRIKSKETLDYKFNFETKERL